MREILVGETNAASTKIYPQHSEEFKRKVRLKLQGPVSTFLQRDKEVC